MRTERLVRRRRRALVGGLIGILILTVLASGVAFAGFRYEQNRSDRILPGITIAGVDVGGMTAKEAERALQPAARAILDRIIDVGVAGKSWQLTAEQLGKGVDVEPAIRAAVAVGSRMGWLDRLKHRLFDRPLDRRFDIEVTYRRDVVRKFVDTVATTIGRPAKRASLDFVEGKLAVVHSRTGTALRSTPAVGSLMDALQAGVSSVTLTTRVLHPKVTDDTLGPTIIIRLSENRLYLYDGLKLEKTYPVATGQPQYPTPLGHWTIINKRINPTWVNPAKDTWGAGEPDFIPPGPDNPLGTRAVDLDASGIRIHGTPDDASIGTYASHGCIRMHIPDSEDLFARVPVGTLVIIVD